MIASLFSVFDPSVYFFISPWLGGLILPLFFLCYNSGSNYFTNLFFLFYKGLCTEFSSVMKANLSGGNLLFLFSGFLFIFLLNFFALFPSIFTVTGHMLFTFSFSLALWSFLLFFSSYMNFYSFLSHLVPFGTPGFLMSFMVLVELVSNLIRPITLSVRLAANIVAGHLLMGLLGNFILINSFPLLVLFSSVGLILTLLELAVSFIQGYVFVTLFSLYSEECH